MNMVKNGHKMKLLENVCYGFRNAIKCVNDAKMNRDACICYVYALERNALSLTNLAVIGKTERWTKSVSFCF